MIDTSTPGLTRAQLLGGMVVNAMSDACAVNNCTAILRDAVLVVRPEFPRDILKVGILFDSVEPNVEFNFDFEVPKESINCDLSEFERDLRIVIDDAVFFVHSPAAVAKSPS